MLAAIFLAAGFLSCHTCRASFQTDGYEALKRAMEAPGQARIILKKDIVIRGVIHVRGEKWVCGNGYTLFRGLSHGGTILSLESGKLILQDLSISGTPKNRKVDRVYGRLINVKGGTLVLEKGSALMHNRDTGRGEEGGGAVTVCRKGKLIIRSGEICGNTTVAQGAAVLVKRGGYMRMKGGVIWGNKSRGIGAIEGFDGRGGAISNYGTVVISGGMLLDNTAAGFSAGQMIYGGVGGMLYNRGSCVITGGTIENNRAACGGGAIYSDRYSTLRILAGNFQGNQADRGRTLFFCGKSCILNVNLKEREIFAKSGCKIRRKGRNGLSEPEGKQRRKRDKIDWDIKGRNRIYYMGEEVGKKELLYGIKAQMDGRDVTSKVFLRRVSGNAGRHYSSDGLFDTKREGHGELIYSVRGKGISKKGIAIPYEVRKNCLPGIRTAPRFLFTWEVRGFSKDHWKKMLWEGVALKDREDREQELWQQAVFDWGGIREGKAGTYRIRVHIRDQWGHRFYMKDGEAMRYGKGREISADIPVTLVEGNDVVQDTRKAVRFLPESQGLYGLVEEWYFPAALLVTVRAHMRTYVNPFSEAANRDFLECFGMANRKRNNGGMNGGK